MTDWVVAIPSYKRPEGVVKKSLHTLLAGGVPASKITVFVSDDPKDEEEHYKALIKPDMAKIVVGKRGLINQRQFIIDYYPKNKLIMFLDDDIGGLKRLKGEHAVDVKNVSAVITEGFNEMKKHGANLWGIYPTANPFYMTDKVTSNLKYIIGAFFGIRNTKDPVYRLKYSDTQEDKERTIRYWQKDGVVVRLNYIAPKTTYFAPGGLDNPTRKADTKKHTDELLKAFPTFFKQVYKPARGIYDLSFVRQPTVPKPESKSPNGVRTKTRKVKKHRTTDE